PAPDRDRGLQILYEVHRPDRLAGLRVETSEVAHGAERVNAIADDARRGAWAKTVADPLVSAVVLVRPDNLTGLRVETEDALLARRRRAEGRVALDRLVGDAIHDVDEPGGHRGPRVPGADRRFPKALRSVGWELLKNPLLAPDAIALRPEPLRPVVGMDAG